MRGPPRSLGPGADHVSSRHRSPAAKPLAHRLSSLFEFLCDFSICFSLSLFVERLISARGRTLVQMSPLLRKPRGWCQWPRARRPSVCCTVASRWPHPLSGPRPLGPSWSPEAYRGLPRKVPRTQGLPGCPKGQRHVCPARMRGRDPKVPCWNPGRPDGCWALWLREEALEELSLPVPSFCFLLLC